MVCTNRDQLLYAARHDEAVLILLFRFRCGCESSPDTRSTRSVLGPQPSIVIAPRICLSTAVKSTLGIMGAGIVCPFGDRSGERARRNHALR